MDVWKMYFVSNDVKFDVEVTPETMMRELIHAIHEHGLLNETEIKQHVLFTNLRRGDRYLYYPATDQQKTIGEMGMESDVLYEIVPDGVVA